RPMRADIAAPGLLAILSLAALPRLATAQHEHEHARRAESDTAFAAMQSRGKSAMGVDQYTSAHQFQAFAGGDFDVPGFVHAGEVPGTAVMRERRSRISYRFQSLPGGGAVRIVTA